MVNTSKAGDPRFWLLWTRSGAVEDAQQSFYRTIGILNPRYPVNYSGQEVPLTYKCGECGATDCKLWRDYQAFLNNQSLLCFECSCREQGKAHIPTEDGLMLYGAVYYLYQTATMDANSWYGYEPKNGPPPDAVRTCIKRCRTDQIGWRVPAVPTTENDTFWGYTSVPQEGCDWWKRLPTLPRRN